MYKAKYTNSNSLKIPYIAESGLRDIKVLTIKEAIKNIASGFLNASRIVRNVLGSEMIIKRINNKSLK